MGKLKSTQTMSTIKVFLRQSLSFSPRRLSPRWYFLYYLALMRESMYFGLGHCLCVWFSNWFYQSQTKGLRERVGREKGVRQQFSIVWLQSVKCRLNCQDKWPKTRPILLATVCVAASFIRFYFVFTPFITGQDFGKTHKGLSPTRHYFSIVKAHFLPTGSNHNRSFDGPLQVVGARICICTCIYIYIHVSVGSAFIFRPLYVCVLYSFDCVSASFSLIDSLFTNLISFYLFSFFSLLFLWHSPVCSTQCLSFASIFFNLVNEAGRAFYVVAAPSCLPSILGYFICIYIGNIYIGTILNAIHLNVRSFVQSNHVGAVKRMPKTLLDTSFGFPRLMSGRGKAKTQAIVGCKRTRPLGTLSFSRLPSPRWDIRESARLVYRSGDPNNLTLIKVNMVVETWDGLLI